MNVKKNGNSTRASTKVHPLKKKILLWVLMPVLVWVLIVLIVF
jgi:hypothetical protein